MNDEWHTLKEKHNLDKMLFFILNLKFNDEFYHFKMILNPLDEAPPNKWIQSGSVEDVVTEAILLDNHYKYDKVDNMSSLLDVIDNKSLALFL